MGFIKNNQKAVAENIYIKDVKPNLKEKDGLIHVIMLNSFSKWLNQNFGCEDKYTTQIDSILTNMQNDGYEIVDIKFNSLKNQGLTGQMEGYETLIIYK
jgi:hypothetical protein